LVKIEINLPGSDEYGYFGAPGLAEAKGAHIAWYLSCVCLSGLYGNKKIELPEVSGQFSVQQCV